jgi:hypothetical protein
MKWCYIESLRVFPTFAISRNSVLLPEEGVILSLVEFDLFLSDVLLLFDAPFLIVESSIFSFDDALNLTGVAFSFSGPGFESKNPLFARWSVMEDLDFLRMDLGAVVVELWE